MKPLRCLYALVVCALAFFPIRSVAEARTELDLSGTGWKLWLDKDAKWESDELFLPPVEVAKLPVNLPTGGWDELNAAMPVSVPGTVEQYLSKGGGPDDDIKGVSWWVRKIKIPRANGARRLFLRFDAVRLRSEVFVDHALVGYDVIGNTPFEVDITDAAKPGDEVELEVRVTDPGGNYDWRDSSSFSWGNYSIPMSHAFGGIIGKVRLVACDPVYIDDVYVQNTPAITNVNVIVTVKNTSDKAERQDIELTLTDKSEVDHLDHLLKTEKLVDYTIMLSLEANTNVMLAPGENVVTLTASVPNAKLWDLEHPNLYVCEVSIDRKGTKDSAQQTFGFRWFAPEDVGSNAVFRLNGKRIVLRTAISWGFWPINGIFPTPELAAKQIQSAKALGLNMLNFHRCIGSPEVLDEADQQGLLYYEEPGAYKAAEGSFGEALAREKLLRMVRRDRSHPSLVIYSMINERNGQRLQERERTDMTDAHKLDPSRVITLSSAWATLVDQPQDIKAHMRPFDSEIHFTGWYDNHHAGGPEVWKQTLYRSPMSYYNRTTNRAEIIYWGEEGAISTPPRLQEIKDALEASPTKGWDGGLYLDWYKRFDDFLTRKDLRGAFKNVEAFTTSMGTVSLYHQGRKIEVMRMTDVADGYAVNGWEAESVENHSGIVDDWRNPKGDPAIMAYYNQPLYIAVMPRSQFAQIPGEVVVDFYAINEKNLHGAHTLMVKVRDPAGHTIFTNEIPVTLSGGEVYGELLASDVKIPVVGATGMFRIEAALTLRGKAHSNEGGSRGDALPLTPALSPGERENGTQTSGKSTTPGGSEIAANNGKGSIVASGHDEVLAVDWKSDKIGGQGATWESQPQVQNFLAKEKGVTADSYRDDLGRLDWVVVTRPAHEGEPVEIPAERFQTLTATFCSDDGFQNQIHQRSDRTVDFFVADGAVPDAQVSVMENYGVLWEGTIVPPSTGLYTFATDSTDGVRLWVNGQLLFDDYYTRDNIINRGRVTLEAGKAVAVRLEYWHRKGAARCKLLWAPPETGGPDLQKLITRVRNDGTTLIILDNAETWMNLITNNTTATYAGTFQIGTAWLGGLHFVREHPLFKGLPVNVAMDWPYQAVVRNGKTRSGLLLEGEELVAGCWHCYPMNLGTAVGIIPCGKGKIIVNTLDIASQLTATDTSAEVARKLLCNFVEWGH